MGKTIVTEEEAKKLLKVDDWRAISKEKIMDFISFIPKIDKDLAISIINQFPNYVSFGTNIINSLIMLCDNTNKDLLEGQKQCLEAYKLVLESLKKQLDNPLSPEERDKINEQMIEIANAISEKDSEKNKIIDGIVSNGQKIITVTLVVGAAILGFHYNNK